MILRKFIVLSALVLLCAGAWAQSSLHLDRSQERRGGGNSKLKSGTEKMIYSKVEYDPASVSYKNYKDDTFESLDKEMKEREWGTEEGAWKHAQEAGTREAYEKFISRYPNGQHVAEANCRLIDAKVEETLNNAHQNLPNIKHVEPDEPEMTSTITVTNHTGLPLSVYYSGTESKSVTIPPNARSTISVENGDYKIAASVPPSSVRPFAGKTQFSGGTYEIGFWIVQSAY